MPTRLSLLAYSIEESCCDHRLFGVGRVALALSRYVLLFMTVTDENAGHVASLLVLRCVL